MDRLISVMSLIGDKVTYHPSIAQRSSYIAVGLFHKIYEQQRESLFSKMSLLELIDVI